MNIDKVQICRYLRLYGRAPGEALEERIRTMLSAADAAFRTASAWRRFEDPFVAGGADSESLAKHLAGCHAVYLACATLGVGFDALQRRTAAKSPADASPSRRRGRAVFPIPKSQVS